MRLKYLCAKKSPAFTVVAKLGATVTRKVMCATVPHCLFEVTMGKILLTQGLNLMQ